MHERSVEGTAKNGKHGTQEPLAFFPKESHQAKTKGSHAGISALRSRRIAVVYCERKQTLMLDVNVAVNINLPIEGALQSSSNCERQDKLGVEDIFRTIYGI